MQPTSPAQFAATTMEGGIPPLERIREGVWVLPMPMPSRHIPYSLCYLIVGDDTSIHVIDPGSAVEANFVLLGRALAAVGGGFESVASIVVTHLHPDHLGMAAMLREKTGAPVMLHRVEQEAVGNLDTALPSDETFDLWGVPSGRRRGLQQAQTVIAGFAADVLLEDGATLPIAGREIRVIHTPGHTPGHICLRDAANSLLFTGDHILPTIFSGLGLGGRTTTNAMADYLGALDTVKVFDDHEILPGHGYRFTGLAERCDAIAEHHLRRSREVSEMLAVNPGATIWQLAEKATWSAGFDNLAGFYLLSALSQIAMHAEYVQLAREL